MAMRFSRIWLKKQQALCLLIMVALPLLAASAGWAALCDIDYNPETSGIPKCMLKLDEGALWQAPGRTISFTITGMDPQTSNIDAYLRFAPHDSKAPNKWTGSWRLTPIQVGETRDKSEIKFSVALPATLELPDVSEHLYPTAELRLMVYEPSASPVILFDTVREVTFSRRWFAFFVALFFVGAASIVLYRFAIFLGVPGTPVLRIISSASGWASLAQLQIILWTLVIGAGAAYVMALRGSLIPISSGALMLLGIAGAAALGSQLKNSQQAQSPPALARPSTIVNLSYVELLDSEVTFSWQVPSDGGVPSAYTVQYKEHGDAVWSTSSAAVTMPRFRLVGLKPSQAYDLRVFATNPAGSGQPEEIQVTTRPGAAVTPGVPGGPTWIGCLDPPTANAVSLSWYPPEQGAQYRVEYRAHDDDDPWLIYCSETISTVATVTGLRPNTLYDFRIIAKNTSGWGSSSAIFRQTTGARQPKWSDIVTDTGRPAEIDVTRVQMLFFTVVSACFVAMKIASVDAIPDIPESYVTLMGISNGVYIGAKFIGR
ncbi:MAG: fibronectin type III domain-containing protein [Syntrophobacteraceae bacterium]|jgi:hypothetical protein